jgi:hypothetical protein
MILKMQSYRPSYIGYWVGIWYTFTPAYAGTIREGINRITAKLLCQANPPERSVKESVAHHLMVRTQQYVPSFLFDLESKRFLDSS